MPTETWLAAWRWCSRRRTSFGVEAPGVELGLELRRAAARRRPLVAQELDQPDDERVGRARRTGGGDGPLGAGPRPCVAASARHPALGPLALVPAPEHLLGQPPQVLEQDQAEHRRHGPELADRQGRDLLERLDEPGDPRLVELAVGVGDQRQGQGVDPGIAAERARRRAWAAPRRSRRAGPARPRGATSSTMWKLSASHSASMPWTSGRSCPRISRRARIRTRRFSMNRFSKGLFTRCRGASGQAVASRRAVASSRSSPRSSAAGWVPAPPGSSPRGKSGVADLPWEGGAREKKGSCRCKSPGHPLSGSRRTDTATSIAVTGCDGMGGCWQQSLRRVRANQQGRAG